MVHYLLVKMTRHIASYYANQKDHPSHNNEFKSTLSKLTWWYFLRLSFGHFVIGFSNKKTFVFMVVELLNYEKIYDMICQRIKGYMHKV
jgi:hypothetical protein